MGNAWPKTHIHMSTHALSLSECLTLHYIDGQVCDCVKRCASVWTVSQSHSVSISREMVWGQTLKAQERGPISATLSSASPSLRYQIAQKQSQLCVCIWVEACDITKTNVFCGFYEGRWSHIQSQCGHVVFASQTQLKDRRSQKTDFCLTYSSQI